MSSITTKCGGRRARFVARLGACLWAVVATSALETRALADPDALRENFQTPDLGSSFDNGTNSVIPCEFYLNGILIPVPTPDKKEAFLIFDTGANEPMLSAAFAEKMRIRGNATFSAAGIGEEVAAGSITNPITFSLPGVTFRNARWAILPNIALDAAYGRPVVGVLGMDLLKGFVIRLDYARQTIEFIKREHFMPPMSETVSLPLTLGDHGPMVAATVESGAGSATGQFLLDTGNNGSLELSRMFQDAHPDVKFKPFAQNGASGVGGVMLISEAICPVLDLGGIRVHNALADLDQTVQGVEASVDGSIGNEIWRRFDLILDLPDNTLYLHRNVHFSDPFNYVSAGMNLLASGDNFGTLIVHEILPGSASDLAGFKPGDVLLKVDELDAKPLTIANVYPLVHRPGVFHITVRRGDQTVPLTLELKSPAMK